MTGRLRLALGVACCVVAPAVGEAAEVRANYIISYIGLQIAKANVAVKIENDLFTARLGYKTSGFVKVVNDAKGEADSTGSMKGGKLLSTGYHLRSDEGDQSKNVVVEGDGTTIKTVSAVPPLKNMDERVPIEPKHMKATIDPLSGVIFPIADPANPLAETNCDRTVPVFDGWTRYDVVFAFKRKDPVKVKGYKGEGITCSVRWVPVAGHRPKQENTKFLAENKDMSVTLVPTRAGVMIPYQVVIQTRQGQVGILAERIDQ